MQSSRRKREAGGRGREKGRGRWREGALRTAANKTAKPSPSLKQKG